MLCVAAATHCTAVLSACAADVECAFVLPFAVGGGVHVNCAAADAIMSRTAFSAKSYCDVLNCIFASVTTLTIIPNSILLSTPGERSMNMKLYTRVCVVEP